MSPRKKHVLYAALVVVALCSLWFLLPGKPEPAYRGIRISRWIRIAGRQELEPGLAKVGPESIPYLTVALTKQDAAWERAWAKLWIKLPSGMKRRLDRWRPIPADQIRRNAIAGLLGFGPEAKSAVPSLIKVAARDPDPMTRSAARMAVGVVGRDSPEAQEFFLRALQSTNRVERSQAALAIYMSGLRLTAAVPLLMRDLGNPQDKPLNELLAFSIIGAEAKPAVAQIVARMDDPAIQGNALTALIGIGGDLKPAVPTLVRLLQGTNEVLRPRAVEALMLAGSDAVDALPALAEVQQDRNPVIRALAAAAIGRIKGTPETAVAGLMEQLRDRGSDGQGWSVRHRLEGPHALRALAFSHRHAAAWLLGDLGPAAQAAVPLLTEAMNSKDAWLRPIAARAVYRITGQADAVLPTLLHSLSDSSDDTFAFLALQALPEMGADALPATDALRALMTRNLNLRQVAVQVLNKVDQAKVSKGGG